MSGSAILGNDLIDDLVGDIDDLRTDLYADFGVRQYAVTVVRRRWSGAERGEGAVVGTVEKLISPPPKYTDRTKYALTPAGRDVEGDARLDEVSLSYTQTELDGGAIAPNEDFYYRVTDALGQGIRPMYFEVASTPIVDRDNAIGWTVLLNRATGIVE